LSREIVRHFNGFFGFELDKVIFDPKNVKFLQFLYDLAPSSLIQKEAWADVSLSNTSSQFFNQVRFESVLKQMALERVTRIFWTD